jgi:hypothetical protein
MAPYWLLSRVISQITDSVKDLSFVEAAKKTTHPK